MKKLLILDCDGVLYPASNITHGDFVSAFEKTAKKFGKWDIVRNENLDSPIGFWERIYGICGKDRAVFDEFCKNMVSNINYEKIRKSHILFNLLTSAKKKFDISILSDNHKYHLEQVMIHRFGMGVADFEAMGIKCYDITSTEKNGKFFPKCAEDSLSEFLKKKNKTVDECIFVDNSMTNVSAGRKIGIETIYISQNRTLQGYLKKINA